MWCGEVQLVYHSVTWLIKLTVNLLYLMLFIVSIECVAKAFVLYPRILYRTRMVFNLFFYTLNYITD